MRLRIATVAALLLPLWCQAQTSTKYTIKIVAGTVIPGYTGDSGAATSAEINVPCDVAFDSGGNLYVADHLNHRIRKVDTNGIITTYAGNGTAGYNGDGAAATSAYLTNPCGLAFDNSNNLYFADTGNSVIRKVTSAGIISTVAGNGTYGFAGDGDKATGANFAHPMSVALDSAGNIYIADTGNNRIRKVTASDGKIATIAGNGATGSPTDGGAATDAQLDHPEGITLDSAGNVYFADFQSHAIRKIDTSGNISLFAGNYARGYSGDGVQATQTSLNYPRAIKFDASGAAYISDSVNCRIRRIAPNGIISTIAGDGTFGSYGDDVAATDAAINGPAGLAIDASGRVFFADAENSIIRRLTPDASAVPTIFPGGAISASAYGAYTSVAQGSWVEIYGTKLAAATRGWRAADFINGMAPSSLAGTSVTVGGRAAYISYVSPGQVNVLLPSDVPTGEQELVVTTASGSSAAYKITVNETLPGLQSVKVDGRSYSASALPSRPVRAGDTITLYGVGFGAVAPVQDAGLMSQQARTLAAQVRVFFGESEASVGYAGLAPGVVGLYQINVTVPSGVAGNAIPLTFSLGGKVSASALYAAVTQ